jgi:hypothetical protein
MLTVQGKDNCEGLCFDGNRLLIACKAEELCETTKRIYEVDMSSWILNPQPVITVDLDEISRVLGSEISQV